MREVEHFSTNQDAIAKREYCGRLLGDAVVDAANGDVTPIMWRSMGVYEGTTDLNPTIGRYANDLGELLAILEVGPPTEGLIEPDARLFTPGEWRAFVEGMKDGEFDT
jgi:hypothetical protein